jgi:hypothetical protein
MSDPTSRSHSDWGGRVTYVSVSPEFGERQLDTEALRDAPGYLVRRYDGSGLVEIESFGDRHLEWVRYLGRSWPDMEILARHALDHPDIGFELESPAISATHGSSKRIDFVDADGSLLEWAVHELDPTGELIVETRHRPNGEVFERTEYEYADNGTISDVRTYDGEGRLVSSMD